MKVKELIEKLQAIEDQEMEVAVHEDPWGWLPLQDLIVVEENRRMFFNSGSLPREKIKVLGLEQ